MVAEVWSGMVQGIQGELVTIQADISEGLPVFGLTGHLSAEVKEAKERVRTALKNTGYHLPPRRVSVNLAPADVKKSGTRYDLAIAVGILTAMGLVPGSSVKGIIFLGELALDGELAPLTGVLAILRAALAAGCTVCAVPLHNVEEASLLPEMTVLGFANLREVVGYLNGKREIPAKKKTGRKREKERERQLMDGFIRGERAADGEAGAGDCRGRLSQPVAGRAARLGKVHACFLCSGDHAPDEPGGDDRRDHRLQCERNVKRGDVSGGDETVPGAVSLGDDGRDVRRRRRAKTGGGDACPPWCPVSG